MNSGVIMTGIVSIFIALILLFVFSGVLIPLGDILKTPIGTLPVILFVVSVVAVIISIIVKMVRA